MLWSVKLLELVISESQDGWLQPNITSIFPSTQTVTFLRSPREHVPVSAFINFLQPLVNFQHLHTVEIDMNLPLNPANRTYFSFAFNQALRHLISKEYAKLQTVRLLFDSSQTITHVAAFRKLYPTLKSVAEARKEVTWEVHVCSGVQMSGLNDMAEGEFKCLTLSGEDVKLTLGEREGALIDVMREMVQDSQATIKTRSNVPVSSPGCSTMVLLTVLQKSAQLPVWEVRIIPRT